MKTRVKDLQKVYEQLSDTDESIKDKFRLIKGQANAVEASADQPQNNGLIHTFNPAYESNGNGVTNGNATNGHGENSHHAVGAVNG